MCEIPSVEIKPLIESGNAQESSDNWNRKWQICLMMWAGEHGDESTCSIALGTGEQMRDSHMLSTNLMMREIVWELLVVGSGCRPAKST